MENANSKKSTAPGCICFGRQSIQIDKEDPACACSACCTCCRCSCHAEVTLWERETVRMSEDSIRYILALKADEVPRLS